MKKTGAEAGAGVGAGRRADVSAAIRLLKKAHPHAKIALKYKGHFQLLVVVILSAQCTDERVNMVSGPLFARFPGARDFTECKLEDLEKMIYSTGFYRAKARNIKAASAKIVAEFGGKVPNNMDDLLSLAGVARKTANVVLNEAFGSPVGIVVDTHVARLAGRLGWVSAEMAKKKDAVKIEKRLMELVPKKEWGKISHLLIHHGRKVCIARKPRCGECSLNKICPFGVRLMLKRL